jgi:hypothetical protein
MLGLRWKSVAWLLHETTKIRPLGLGVLGVYVNEGGEGPFL